MLTVERRPWGWFVVLARLPFAWLKIIRVREGHRTSLQWHARRKEYWLAFVSGGTARVGSVRQGRWHRLHGPTLILELAWGAPREDDVHRIDDDYGRSCCCYHIQPSPHEEVDDVAVLTSDRFPSKKTIAGGKR